MGNFDSAELEGVDISLFTGEKFDEDYNSFRIGFGLRYNF
jgi:hypothetical protein